MAQGVEDSPSRQPVWAWVLGPRAGELTGSDYVLGSPFLFKPILVDLIFLGNYLYFWFIVLFTAFSGVSNCLYCLPLSCPHQSSQVFASLENMLYFLIYCFQVLFVIFLFVLSWFMNFYRISWILHLDCVPSFLREVALSATVLREQACPKGSC